MVTSAQKRTTGDFEDAADLARSLHAIGHPLRLGILHSLLSGPRTAEDIATAVLAAAPQVRAHLAALESAGLVIRYPSEDGELFETDQRSAALFNASVVHLLTSQASSIAPAVAEAAGDGVELLPLRVPAAPDACLSCQNSPFVQQVLDSLEQVLDEARGYHARLQQMSSQVLTAQEAERKRIARELHDDTAQALTSILIRLRLLERSSEDEDIRRNVEELRELTGGALDAVRRMAVDLRPAELDHLGLVPALRAYAEKFSQARPIDARVRVEGLKRRLPAAMELVLYRVAQEALTNIAKHSGARSAEVVLARKRGVVTLTVRDNGKGFYPENVSTADGSGLGLFGMRERLALVRGIVEVESSPGGGTTITARIPLPRLRKPQA